MEGGGLGSGGFPVRAVGWLLPCDYHHYGYDGDGGDDDDGGDDGTWWWLTWEGVPLLPARPMLKPGGGGPAEDDGDDGHKIIIL